jgi:hypothetical protein
MRMWKVPVQMLCRKHLLGEHVDAPTARMHMFVGASRKRAVGAGKSIAGYISKGLVEIHSISRRLRRRRDNELAEEMERRGYTHKSPLAYVGEMIGEVDVESNILELNRCHLCREMQWNLKNWKGPIEAYGK